MALGLGTLLATAWLQADRFPLKEGHRWEYRETVRSEGADQAGRRVMRVAGRDRVGDLEGFVILGWGGVDRALLAVDERGVRVLRTGGDTQEGAPYFFRFPLQVGSKWEAKLKIGEETRAMKFEAAAEEAVEVPAGRYETVRVEVTVAGWEGRIEVWLAAGVGEVKSRFVQGDSEMLAELTLFEARVIRFHCATCGRLSDTQALCCGKRPPEGEFVRPASVCRCALVHGGGKCKCLHCKGEPGAFCYCDDRGCRCGVAKDGCRCGHCRGTDAGDDGRGGCACAGEE